MKINRRMFALAPIGLPLFDTGTATPTDVVFEASPEKSFVPLSPEVVLEMLLATPFQSPLLPAYASEATIVEWSGADDEDFRESLGGVALSIDPDDSDAFIGVISIFPDEAMARALVDPLIPESGSTPTDRRIEIGGAVGVSSLFEAPSGLSDNLSYAFSTVSTSFAVIAGAAWGESVVGLEMSSVANLVATLDHFNRVVTSIQT